MAAILPFEDPSRTSCPNSIEVCTYRKPLDNSVILANIAHVSLGSSDMTRRPIVTAEPMSHDEAMALATAYAEAHSVPVVYEKRAVEH